MPQTNRERLINALQSGGDAVLDEIPYGKVIKAVMEGWKHSS